MTTTTPATPASPGSGPVPAWAKPRPAALPTEPRSYPHFLRTPRARWWRGLLALVSLAVATLVLSAAAGAIAIGIDIASGRISAAQALAGDITVTPTLFLLNNLSLAALLPISMLLQWAFFGVRPRWASSVSGGFRWRWFGRAALIVVPVFLVYGAIFTWVGRDELGGLSPDALFLLLAVLLTTPFQAAGEEYAFRGLAARAVGSWFRGATVALVVGGVVANLLFMAAHAATDPWLIGYYFWFGAVLSVVAWRTGGLEAPVLIHLVNNVLLLVPVALFGDVSGAFDRGPGTGGPIMIVPMLVIAGVGVLVTWQARRHGVPALSVPQSSPAPVLPMEESRS